MIDKMIAYNFDLLEILRKGSWTKKTLKKHKNI